MKYKKGYKYVLAESVSVQTNIFPAGVVNVDDFIVLTNSGILTIKKGYAWDGASGPVPDIAQVMRGSLVHDALYQLMREGLLCFSWFDEANKTLRTICVEDGLPFLFAEIMYLGVWLFGRRYAKPQMDKITTI